MAGSSFREFRDDTDFRIGLLNNVNDREDNELVILAKMIVGADKALAYLAGNVAEDGRGLVPKDQFTSSLKNFLEEIKNLQTAVRIINTRLLALEVVSRSEATPPFSVIVDAFRMITRTTPHRKVTKIDPIETSEITLGTKKREVFMLDTGTRQKAPNAPEDSIASESPFFTAQEVKIDTFEWIVRDHAHVGNYLDMYGGAIKHDGNNNIDVLATERSARTPIQYDGGNNYSLREEVIIVPSFMDIGLKYSDGTDHPGSIKHEDSSSRFEVLNRTFPHDVIGITDHGFLHLGSTLIDNPDEGPDITGTVTRWDKTSQLTLFDQVMLGVLQQGVTLAIAQGAGKLGQVVSSGISAAIKNFPEGISKVTAGLKLPQWGGKITQQILGQAGKTASEWMESVTGPVTTGSTFDLQRERIDSVNGADVETASMDGSATLIIRRSLVDREIPGGETGNLISFATKDTLTARYDGDIKVPTRNSLFVIDDMVHLEVHTFEPDHPVGITHMADMRIDLAALTAAGITSIWTKSASAPGEYDMLFGYLDAAGQGFAWFPVIRNDSDFPNNPGWIRYDPVL